VEKEIFRATGVAFSTIAVYVSAGSLPSSLPSSSRAREFWNKPVKIVYTLNLAILYLDDHE
jgi:hypothetical protein